MKIFSCQGFVISSGAAFIKVCCFEFCNRR